MSAAAISGLSFYHDAAAVEALIAAAKKEEGVLQRKYYVALANFDALAWQWFGPATGDFSIDYGVIGVRYSFEGFRQMIFANARLENSTTQDGLEVGNVYTIGVRWDLP